jgi:hypothetical protein
LLSPALGLVLSTEALDFHLVIPAKGRQIFLKLRDDATRLSGARRRYRRTFVPGRALLLALQ